MNKYKYLSLFLFLTGTTLSLSAQHHLSATAQRLEQRGYVNVQTMDRSIFVSLMYSRPDNFTGTVLYGDLREAYLHPDAAKALEKAQRRLKQQHPELSLKVYDAARPIGIPCSRRGTAQLRTRRGRDSVRPERRHLADGYQDRPHGTGVRVGTDAAQPTTARRGDALRRVHTAERRVVALQLLFASDSKKIL